MQKSPNTSNRVIMVRPQHFGFNSETADSNSFQQQIGMDKITESAMLEFENTVALLQAFGLDVTVFDSPGAVTPDAVFPNNWISMHEDGKVVLYPMMAENRRAERNVVIVDFLKEHYDVTEIIDLTAYEKEQKFLEGTGSIVFDHEYKLAYACLSPRTNEEVLKDVCRKLQYNYLIFEAGDLQGKSIYHTNVVMNIGSGYSIICLDCIENAMERSFITENLKKSNKEIIGISFDQLQHFAGNMLEVQNQQGEKFLVMSSTAYRCMNEEQLDKIKSFVRPLVTDIPVIEQIGGGSIRCMLAGNNLPVH